MHRKDLLNLLDLYKPTDKKEKSYKEQIILFVKENKNCFERELDIGHITASAWVLNKLGDKALLLHHMKLDKWFQLGGHADGDTDALAVAIKEAREESGIDSIEAIDKNIFDVDVHLIPANSKEKKHFHYDVRFLLQVKGDEELVSNGESKELRWVSKNSDELPTREESVTRMYNKWINRYS